MAGTYKTGTPTPTEARKIPTPEGKGWWMVRELATKNKGKRRPPITTAALASLLGTDQPYAEHLLDEATAMGWMREGEGGWQGKL